MRTKTDIFQSVASLASITLALSEIRGGRVEAALEHLEFFVDVELSALGRETQRLDPSTRALIAGSLRALKAYRQRCPRRPRPDLLTHDQAEYAKIAALAEESEAFLKSLPP